MLLISFTSSTFELRASLKTKKLKSAGGPYKQFEGLPRLNPPCSWQDCYIWGTQFDSFPIFWSLLEPLGRYKTTTPAWNPASYSGHNLEQNCFESCIIGESFSKHRSCTDSSLSSSPWKQCCCVFKRKPDSSAFVGSNIELGEGDFFPRSRCFGNSFVS